MNLFSIKKIQPPNKVVSAANQTLQLLHEVEEQKSHTSESSSSTAASCNPPHLHTYKLN